MNDTELLELAARAAGLRVSNRLTRGGLSVCSVERRAPHKWNPLTDDGDALRLLAKLNMQVKVAAPLTYAGFDGRPVQAESHEAGPYAATRRAIVRAAAEIGRSM